MIGQGQDFIYSNIIIYTFVLSSNCESVWNVKPSLETLRIDLDKKRDNLCICLVITDRHGHCSPVE